MATSVEESFRKWVDEAQKEGLLDIKFAIDRKAVSRREILDSFLTAEEGKTNCVDPPTPKEIQDNIFLEEFAKQAEDRE